MRIHVVSDVHGNVDGLARAGAGADAFFCLGDMVLFLDYADPSRGIFAELFGAPAAARLIELRTAGRFAEAHALSTELWSQYGDRRAEVVGQAVEAQYAAMFAVLPTPSYLTYGNVDLPGMWPKYLRPGMQVLDGQTVSLGGCRFGFVGGGLRTPMRTPYELDEEVFAAKVAALGAVDVVCSHIPPAVPELLYDVAGRRLERGSEALLDLIRQTSPQLVLFGHVHNPLAARTRIGRTECVNVGHFRATGTPYLLEI